MITLSDEKRIRLAEMIKNNHSTAMISGALCIPKAFVQKLKVQYISDNKKSLFAVQRTTLQQLSEAQLKRLQSLVSLDCSVSTICSALNMEVVNVKALIKELKSL